MNIEDTIVYTNISLGLSIVHRNALERLEDLSVTTPFTKETEKELSVSQFRRSESPVDQYSQEDNREENV